MSSKVEELKKDIAEFQHLLEQATRQKSKDVLTLEVRRLETELIKILDESKTESVKPVHSTSNASQKRYEVKLNNYGWDQTDKMVKLYVKVKDVSSLPKEAISCNFTEKSFDLRVLGQDNKNYNLYINNLCENIDPAASFFKVKADTVFVSLVKEVPKHWPHVTGVEKKIKESKAPSVPDMNDEGDVGASLMNLMKKMYQDGDDEMKKVIAKAWTESQQMNTAGLSGHSNS